MYVIECVIVCVIVGVCMGVTENIFFLFLSFSLSLYIYIYIYIYNIHLDLLTIIESWFNTSFTCVRWGRHSTAFFKLTAGVRQGGVLSSKLFAIFVDDLSQKINSRDLDCHMSLQCTSIFFI